MKAKAHLDLSKDENGQWSMKYHTPERVFPRLKSKEALEGELEFHSNPFIKMHTPDNVSARRYHVERQRPALRWFCKKYGVECPPWLEGNMHYDSLPPDQFKELFGEDKLKVREYEPMETAEASDASPQ